MRSLAAALAFTGAAALGGHALAAPAAPLQAQRSLVIEEMHSEIRVQPDGDLLVTETLRPRFRGSWNGILRNLSLRPPQAYDARYLLAAELISATDEDGRSLRHESSRIGSDVRQFKVWVPDAEDRTATVVLTYRVGNALGHYEAHEPSGTGPWDELYWQVTGTEWEVPILRASARMHLPAGAELMQAAAYAGSGTGEQEEVRTDEAGFVSVGPVGPLMPGAGLTLAAGWPAGFVARPAPGDRPAAPSMEPPSAFGLWPLLLPLAVFWLAYRAWDRRGRDPRELAVATRWEPPEGVTPAEAGTLVDHRPGMHDIISTLVDLAVRGWLVIDERDRRGFLATGKDYTFHAMRPRADWSSLAEHERLFLEGLFDTATRPELAEALSALPGIGGLIDRFTDDDEPAPEGAHDTVKLSQLEDRFYKKIPKIGDALQRALVARGYYTRRPDHVRARWMIMAVVAFFAGGLGLPMAAAAGGTPTAILAGICLIAAGIMSAVILGIFGWLMAARTEAGARTREAFLGFKRFLERVESPRYRRMITSPDMFEAYLPFAIAFRCEEKWARAFEGLLSEPPRWYRGAHGPTFHAESFARSISTLTSATTSTLSSSPSSTGSGGGGSVGGGGGGGGGGGF